ncbi:RNA polymerase sigma factor [Schlesneria paludicola]|uniref:RNA polymerase sigma factor n=1 Tax=Schlesneria paludicola TaxID=360056 RepID=UPI0012F8D716|nr:sigma-70 family RNA polymerase sigma factor [Schlesneria paludicola]
MQNIMTQPQGGISGVDEATAATHESRLVEDARRGSQSAFGELVTRYERRLIRVILQFVKSQELAEDLTQEAFLKAYQRLGQFDASRRFGPWLFRIGVNQTLDYLRRRKRRGWWLLFSERGTERDPDPAIADPRQQLDLEQEVAAVLEQIPENYRVVLILRELQNFSTCDIAAILGRKEATVRWRLAEARSMFHDLWVKRRDGATGVACPISMDEVPAVERDSSQPSGRKVTTRKGKEVE